MISDILKKKSSHGISNRWKIGRNIKKKKEYLEISHGHLKATERVSNLNACSDLKKKMFCLHSSLNWFNIIHTVENVQSVIVT